MSTEGLSPEALLDRAQTLVERLQVSERLTTAEYCREALRRCSGGATPFVIAEAVSALFLALHLTTGPPSKIFDHARGLLQ